MFHHDCAAIFAKKRKKRIFLKKEAKKRIYKRKEEKEAEWDARANVSLSERRKNSNLLTMMTDQDKIQLFDHY